MPLDVIDLTTALVKRPSITPHDAGCQQLIADYLKPLGFQIKLFNHAGVSNLWARYGDLLSPCFVFAGHTDVVPPGPLDLWETAPFEPQQRNGYLYGRGTTDMKSSIAAMLCACHNFLKNQSCRGSIAFLITSDEEGPAQYGTRYVVEQLMQQHQNITTQQPLWDWCLVGEPSCDQQLGDTIKIGRRGSLNAHLTITGQQRHIAYVQPGDNPIHTALPFLEALRKTSWDSGSENFPPTRLQISNIHSGLHVTNMTPDETRILFNIRYSPATDAYQLKQRILTLLDQHALNYHIDWEHSAEPFLSPRGTLYQACHDAITHITGLTPQTATDGGTSDARFIAKTGCELLEFGPCNATIHQPNECINIAQLHQLEKIYYQLLQALLG